MSAISDVQMAQLFEILNNIQKDVTEIKKEMTEVRKDITDLKIGIAKLESNSANLKEDVQELKSTQKNQLWAIISLLGVAVVGTVIREFITVPKI